ncbi:MAG: hypothetical protein KC475_02415 [Cyanobacteria bacterium HKST-UBA03]|nr:hypothetical protein [Cyanobacteria bacterium HKST-UBA03]
MWKQVTAGLAATLALGSVGVFAYKGIAPDTSLDEAIGSAFKQASITLDQQQINLIRSQVAGAVETHCRFSQGNSKVDFAAVEIAQALQLNPKLDQSLVGRITGAIETIAKDTHQCQALANRDNRRITEPMVADESWEDYFNQTIALTGNRQFLDLVGQKQFHPVKISWEDIGRYKNSVWGDRISDVGIWVRKDERQPDSAQLAMSVRRDGNFRDKVLVVPADKIKVHTKSGSRTLEKTLPQRLQELGLTSKQHDKHVIVSNQFAVVPVPSHQMRDASVAGKPPRAAFNFSIYPYGSTNFVITDVIEGSANAIVGPGNHQLLYADINGQKAPFTASRAEDRPDLLQLEKQLKAQGMDVDVQRYYLIQIPLKKEATSIGLSNMGEPPNRHYYYPDAPPMYEAEEMGSGNVAYDMAAPMPTTSAGGMLKTQKSAAAKPEALRRNGPGLTKVAIGHGETEGRYNAGSGYRGQRAEEPVRVTVVYFVTPTGEITEADMNAFAKAFEQWDNQAIWGGSFVVKDEVAKN